MLYGYNSLTYKDMFVIYRQYYLDYLNRKSLFNYYYYDYSAPLSFVDYLYFIIGLDLETSIKITEKSLY